MTALASASVRSKEAGRGSSARGLGLTHASQVKFTPRTGKLELHTRKLEMGLLKASGVLTHDVQNRQVNFAWRLTSKWSADRGKVREAPCAAESHASAWARGGLGDVGGAR